MMNEILNKEKFETRDEALRKKQDLDLDKTPKNDLIFKILFGNEEKPNLLIDLLNAILRPKAPIVSVKIKPTELNPEVIGRKGVRLDIFAETSTGELINIEMQKEDEHNIRSRSLFNWSRIFYGQATVGEKYQDLKALWRFHSGR